MATQNPNLLNLPNPVDQALDLANPDVVQINGNIINTAAAENVSLNALDATYIYINVNGEVLSKEAADRKLSSSCMYGLGHTLTS